MADVKLSEPYDPKKTLYAALRRGGLALAAIVAAALIQAAQDPKVLESVLGSGKLALSLIPLIVAAASAYANWSKNKDK